MARSEPQVIEQLVQTGKARFEFRHYPAHTNSAFAAQAMECAADQGGNAFWQFHDEYMTSAALRGSRSRAAEYAEEIGLNTEQFQQCMDDNVHLARIRSEFTAAINAGVKLTPTIFVNERRAGTAVAAIVNAVEDATP